MPKPVQTSTRPPEPKLSVIICTRDRPKKLLACIASIAESVALASVSAEIVLVENGSQNSELLADSDVLVAGRGLCRLTRLAKGSLSEARNVGLGLAKGELFVFVDDDCLLAVDYMSDVLHHAEAMQGAGVTHYLIGGRVRLGDPEDLPFTIKNEPESQNFHTGIHPGGFIQGCNFFLPRRTAELIGTFDQRFGAGARFRAGEDTDYLIRAHGAGIPIRYVPDMEVSHWHGRKTFAEIDRLNRNYAYANGAILAKHLVRHPWLAKHMAWTLRSAVLERMGGPRFDAAVGLSWASVLRAQFRGIAAFLSERLGSRRMAL